MKWRIAIPLVIIVGVIGYLIYGSIKSPSVSEDIHRSFPVTIRRFAHTLQKERDAQKAKKYCSQLACQQCGNLLAEIARRERANPSFSFDRFMIDAEPGGQIGHVDLIDGQGQTFLVVRCKATRLPDETWRIIEVTWTPPIVP